MTRLVHPFAFALATLAATVCLLFNADNALELRTLDSLLALAHAQRVIAEPDPDTIAVVGIDNAFVDGLDRPVSLIHSELGDAMGAISRSGAKAIGVDFVLPEKRFDQLQLKSSPLDFHRQLLKGLIQATSQAPVVAAKTWDLEHQTFRPIHVDFLSVLARQSGVFQSHASAMLCDQADGSVRKIPGADCQPDGQSHYLVGELLNALGVPFKPKGLIDYELGEPWTYVPISKVLEHVRAADHRWLNEQFGGRIVLLGSVLNDVDLYRVPQPIAEWLPHSKQVPRVLVHAQILRTHLSNVELQPLCNWALLVFAGVALLFFLTPVTGQSVRVAVLAVLAMLWAAMLFIAYALWLPITSFALAVGLVLLVRWCADALVGLQEKRCLKLAFGGAVSPTVMQAIMGGGLSAETKGSRKQVCVLFSDIRGFTALSETLQPEQVVSLLNRYFDSMTAVVHRHGGTVDKFIGDGLMAFFGAPNPLPHVELQALGAVRDMVNALEVLNLELGWSGLPTLTIGIGLHSGEALIGFLGGQQRYEYTAIGDTVNVAARVEGLCKRLSCRVLVSESVRNAVMRSDPKAFQFESMGMQSLRGRSSDMPVYAICEMK